MAREEWETVVARNERRDAAFTGTALLSKACDVLEAVSAAPGGISQADLASQMGLSRTTLYRILGKLVARGLLRQDPARRVYGLGFRLLEMAHAAWTAPDLPAVAAPELRHLRDSTGETAYVAVLEGREVVSLGKYEGAHEVRSAARLGERKPLHCTSQGKAILAFLPEPEREALMRRMPLRQFTPYTLTDRRQLQAALEDIRTRGYATDDEEIVEGVRCVGAPVLDSEGKVLGAISIAGPAVRMTRERLALLGPEVAATAQRIGVQMRPPDETASAPVALDEPACRRGIGPLWADQEARLWWADGPGGELRCREAEGDGRTVASGGTPIRALALAGSGEVLVVEQGGLLCRLDSTGRVVAERRGEEIDRLRALRARPGSDELWAAMSGPDVGISRIGVLQPDGTLHTHWRLPGEVTELAWAERGAVLYAATPAAGTIHRLEPGRTVGLLLTRLSPGSGQPVGLAADAAGDLWVALSGGWSVVQLDQNGEIRRVLPVPVPCPCGLGFGGPDRRTLYVCTSREGVAEDVLASAPLSGRLLVTTPGVAGPAEAGTDWLAGAAG